MDNRDGFFLGVFLGSLVTVLYFMGGAFTGYVTQSTYCDSYGCYARCDYDIDCSSGTCCDVQGEGVCMQECSNPYVYTVEYKPLIDIDQISARVEQPTNVTPVYGAVYVLMFAFILIIGVIYLELSMRKK